MVNTHDLEFRLPDHDVLLRTILVAPSCLEDANRPTTLARAEEFATVNNNGGNDSRLAILYLLSDKASQTSRGRYKVDGLISLQTLYVVLVSNCL